MRPRQRGAGLAGLMVSLGLSLGIVLSALHLAALSGADYVRAEQHALLQEQAAQVLELLAAIVQQAGHVDPTQPMPARAARPPDGALRGLDDAVVPASSDWLVAARHGNGGGSDALAIHVAGDALGRLRNCAGMPVPEAVDAYDDRGASIFHVADGPQGEPELRCKYHGDTGWSSQAIAAGVASFQLLYGIDTDGDGLPNDFVSASRLQALAAGSAAAVSPWTRVVAVQVALLMRSRQPVPGTPRPTGFDLFGSAYGDLHAADDPGARVPAGQLQPGRLYRLFEAVIFLGNSLRPAT